MAAGGATAPARDQALARVRVARWSSLASATFALVGAVFVGIGVSALPSPWTHGYVSEGGVAGAGHAPIYRTGIAALALSIGLLGVALAQRSPQNRLHQAAWLSLTVAAALGLVSSRVSCTAGCPLPPYQRTTFQDLVHAASSVGAVGFTALAVLIIAFTYPDRRLRRVAQAATAICWPLLIGLALAILIAGRGELTSVLERISLLAVLASVVGIALTISAGAHQRTRRVR